MPKASGASNYSVVVCCERRLNFKQAKDVEALFTRHPGPVTVKALKKSLAVRKENPDDFLKWDDIFDAIRELRTTEKISPATCVCLLTITENDRNWFAVQDPEDMRNGFCHVGDFKWVTSAPNSTISAHYIMKGIFNMLLHEKGIELDDVWHEVARGCFFDFCQNKEDLNLKLRTADICGDCLEIFQTIEVPHALIAQTVSLMEETRLQAVNTAQFLPPAQTFQAWPFPVAITRHKAVQAINPLLKFMLMLDHFDSMVRYFYIAHEIESGRAPAIEDKPSLGWWVEQLSHSLKGTEDFKAVVTIAETENVVALRNERRGHGWMSSTEESYRSEANKLEMVLGRIEDQLRPFFEKYRLVIPQNIALQDGKFYVEGIQLMGSHVLHPHFEFILNRDPREIGLKAQHRVYLTDGNMSEFKLMAPFVRYEDCPLCNEPRLLITDGGNQFIDVQVGHRVVLKPS